MKRTCVGLSCLIRQAALVGLCLVAFGAPGLADELSASRTALDAAPFLSARAAGMGGALSTVADALDATYYNPAGLGGDGKNSEGKRGPLLKQLSVPVVGVAANENTVHYSKALQAAQESSTLASAALDANTGKRQYGRVSFGIDALVGHVLLLPFTDQQIAAVSQGNGTNMVSAHYRSLNGAGIGFGTAPSKSRLSLGVYTYYANRAEVVGDFSLYQLIDAGRRSDAIKAAESKYTGHPVNAGLTWRIADKGSPTLAVVARDLGNTTWHNADATKPDSITPTDLTLGLSYSPRLSADSILNIIFEGEHLSESDVALDKKFRSGLELLYGGIGSTAMGALRLGYNLAGISFGCGANLGLISLQLASQAEDVGVGNLHMVERRNIAYLMINVADY